MTSVEQDAAHFFSNFGNDLLEPPIHAIDQHSAPIFRTKEPTGFAFGPRPARPDVLPQDTLISSSKGPHLCTLESC
jgi:hypothetical protein